MPAGDYPPYRTYLQGGLNNYMLTLTADTADYLCDERWSPCEPPQASPHHKKKGWSDRGVTISKEALQEMGSKLEQSFATLWIERYPEIDLFTQVPFAFSPRSKVRASKLRADFATGPNIQFVKSKPFMLLPPGVIIEIDGNVHKYKWTEDVQKETVARELGFKFHRVYEQTMELMLDAIALDILDLHKFSSK